LSREALAPPARIVRHARAARAGRPARRDRPRLAAAGGEASEACARTVAARLPLLAARLWRSPYLPRVRAAGLSPGDLQAPLT
jgi:hypothetical protein